MMPTWAKVMTSEGEQRPTLVTAGYGRHGIQLVKEANNAKGVQSVSITAYMVLWPSRYYLHEFVLPGNLGKKAGNSGFEFVSKKK